MKRNLALSSYIMMLLSLLFCALAGYAGAPLHSAFVFLSLLAGLWTIVALIRCATFYAKA